LFEFQRTLRKKIIFSGLGLHTGSKTNMTVYPAKENSGVIFKRIDLDNEVVIKASVENVVETKRGTTIGINGYKIYTIEHFLSALNGLGIDNAYIEIDNIEPPVFDGSSKVFVDEIINIGIKKYDIKKIYVNISKSMEYIDDQCSMKIIPYDKFKVSYYGNFKYGNIGKQEYIYTSANDYIKEVSCARTFCSIAELIHLKDNGLIKGADLNSGIVFLDDRINQDDIKNILVKMNLEVKSLKNKNYTLNNISLRYDNEPIRHKVLDLLGDFSLLGYGLKGHIISYGGGHASNIGMMKKIDTIYG